MRKNIITIFLSAGMAQAGGLNEFIHVRRKARFRFLISIAQTPLKIKGYQHRF